LGYTLDDGTPRNQVGAYLPLQQTVRWPLFLLRFTRVLGITHSPKLRPFLYPFILFLLCNTAGLITRLLDGRRKQEVRKKLTVLLTVALIALMMMVASATPGMAAAKK
jgi:hypothetical protein